MTNNEINEKATEYAKLDPVAEKARRLSIRDEIWAYEYGKIKVRQGKAVGSLPKFVGYDGTLDIDIFVTTFQKVMPGLLDKFDPAKATFTTLLGQRLRQRLTTAYGDDKREGENLPLTAGTIINEDGEEINVLDILPAPEPTNEDNRSEFEVFCALAPLVADKKELDSHRRKNGRSYFEGFYTFDAVSLTKKGTFTEEELTAENDLLFPVMERVVVGYLLEGEFASMADIPRNPVRDVKLLNKRQEAMMVCYKISDTTVGTKNKLYVKLILSLGDRGF